MTIERDALGDMDSESLVDSDADALQAREKLGMGDDPRAAADEVVARVLEYVHLPAATQQQIGGEEAAQRAADDERTRVRARARHGGSRGFQAARWASCAGKLSSIVTWL